MSLTPQRAEVEGGGRILFLPNPASPFISFTGSLPAGVAAERQGEEGVAEFLSRLLLSGTERRSARRIAESMEGLGATLEFHVAEDILFFRGRCTRRTAPKVFATLADVLASPVLPAKEVERLRSEVLTDIERERDSTREMAEHEMLALMFPDRHPYGRDPKGEPEQVKGIEPRALLEFHARTYGRGDLVLSLAGDVDADLVGSTVAKAVTALPHGGPPPRAPAPAPGKPGARFLDMPSKSQADIALGLQAIPRVHPDFYALSLANLLFGIIGMYGRLGASVREEKGLAYYSYSRLRVLRSGGHWSVLAGVNPGNLETAIAAISAEMDRLRSEPFTEDEADMGRRNQVGGLAVNLERNAEVAGALHEIEFHGLGADYLDRYPGIVNGLAREEIVAAAERYFRKADCSLVVAGPIGGRTFSL